MGVTKCGIPSYWVSSTRLGSTSIIRTSSGVARIMTEVMRELTNLDLPEPVAPATSRWGILATLAITNPPSTSLPCLLYTSDAADDLLCVDLGGRRIIKKK